MGEMTLDLSSYRDLPSWLTSLRPHQPPAIESVVSMFDSGAKIVTLDAPVGSGKTLVAEMVRRLGKYKTLYTCSDRALQNQFQGDFPYARVLKGKRNYPTLDFPDAFHDKFAPITCEDCDRVKEDCTYCADVDDCPYRVAKWEAVESDLACTNIQYLLGECRSEGSQLSGKFDLIVIDEADLLEGIIMGQVTVSLSGRLKTRLKIPEPRKLTRPDPTMKDVDGWLDWLLAAQDRIDSARRKLGKTLADRRRARHYVSLLEQLPFIADEMPYGGWVHDDYQTGATTLKPIRVDKWVPKLLWHHAPRFLLMSGTIIDHDYLMRELGADTYPTDSVTVPSTFPSDRRPVRIVPVASMTEKSKQEGSWALMALAVRNVMALHPSESILVHTVSYAFATYLASVLPSDRIILYTEASAKDDALVEFKSRAAPVMIAASMDRGVDLPDDLCTVNVICKIPYPNLGDKQISARLREPDGQGWYSVQSVRTLVQMLGRGFRHEDDRCVNYILDGQFLRLHSQWGHLIPKWIRDAYQWGGPWDKQIEI